MTRKFKNKDPIIWKDGLSGGRYKGIIIDKLGWIKTYRIYLTGRGEMSCKEDELQLDVIQKLKNLKCSK